MKIALTKYEDIKKPCDLLIIGTYKNNKKDNIEITKLIKNLDNQLEHFLLAPALDEGFLANKNQIFLTATQNKIKANKLALIGLGEKHEENIDLFRKSGAETYKKAQAIRARKIIYVIPEETTLPIFDIIQGLTEGLILASYKFSKYLTKEKPKNYVEEIQIALFEAPSSDKQISLNRGLIIAEAVCMARDLINEGASNLTPAKLAEYAQELANNTTNLTINILDHKMLKKEKLNLLLAVGSASIEVAPPTLVRIEYKPKKISKKTLVLAGKGVTFDSGGLNIKPTEGMLEMKSDMSGAAAVLGIMQVIAKLEPKINIIGYLACVENGIGPRSYHQGDIIISKKGLSVEITNTDAEGRLILADAIAYAIEKDNPDILIDLATLTGACMVALGRNTAGIFSNDDNLAQAIYDSGKSAGESYWQMPLSKNLKDELKSPIADLKNCGERYGGAITAALFLQAFINNNIKWAHLDIAGPASKSKDISYYSQGGTGFGIRTLIDYIMGLN